MEEETELVLKRICDTLLSAGYFRVRIRGLAPFDKVVGGLVWSISNATAALPDLADQTKVPELSFSEELSIGLKIRLCDEIVRALIALQCPLELQSHQIQGLDTPRIFPVVQWLVKLVLKTRNERGAFLRERAKCEAQGLEYGIGRKIELGYVPSAKRLLRKSPGMKFESVPACAEFTLLEYGITPCLSKGSSSAGSGTGKEVKSEEKEKKSISVKKDSELTEAKGESVLSREQVGSILGDKVNSIVSMTKTYESKVQADLADIGLLNNENFIHRKKIDGYDKEISVLEASILAEKQMFRSLNETFGSYAAKLEEVKAQVCVLENEGKELSLQLESRQRKGVTWQQLWSLVQLNETLKANEVKFKGSCKARLEEFQTMIAEIENQQVDARLLEIEEAFNAESSKFQRFRSVLSKRNLDVADLERKLEDVPSRGELLQYERRFIELYDLVSSKIEEFRKYFAQYNTLEQTLSFVTKEISLLKSIQEGYVKASQNSAAKESLRDSVANILKNLSQSKDKLASELDVEVKKVNALIDTKSKLLEQQREYARIVKEFQDMCQLNEKLRGQ